MEYGFSKSVDIAFEQAIEKITGELKKEGFGILTEIDVRDTLKKKLDVEFKKYKILGACNPPFAHKALELEENIGLLLPCNVVVYEKDNKSVVSVFNPLIMNVFVDNKELSEIAGEVKQKLQNALNRI